jgi:hypothetical protein
MLLCDCLMLGYAFSVWEMSDYFEITWTIFALGSASVPHASMRAWRFEPLPEIRTVMFFSAMFLIYEAGRERFWCQCKRSCQ